MVKMSEEIKKIKPSDSCEPNDEVIKEEVSLQFHLYIIIFAIIYYISWVIPGFVFWLYFFFPFRIFFLQNIGFLSLFTNLSSLITLIIMPLVIIGCYLLHLILIGLTTWFIWGITEKTSPSKSGIIPRNIRSRTANYYHIRSFMIKYGKNTFTKGMFPWLSNWFFNFVGSNNIGKGTTLEESVGNDKFINIGENCYIGVNSTLASHLIQGIFGNISYFKINVGNNVTLASMCGIGPGSEIYDNAFLLPLASTPKHSEIKENNYYFGLPMRKIFRKKIIKYLDVTPKDLEMNENIEGYKDEKLLKEIKKKKRYPKNEAESLDRDQILGDLQEDKIITDNLSPDDLAIDFTTSSAISRVNIKFLIVYLPIFWLSGLIVTIIWYWYSRAQVSSNFQWAFFFFFPFALFGLIYIFIAGCLLFTKLFLIIINLIHKPKEGVFKAEKRDTNFEFWMLRTELKKIALWLFRNSPFPWTDVFAFKQLGVNMDFSSHLADAWCDSDFIKFGRKVMIGQGATIMSSMVVGKYLLIKKVFFDDYVMVGGHTTISPGTIIGKESIIGAISSTTFDQALKPAWIYLGIPARKLKENKYAEERRDIIIKRQVAEAKKFEMSYEVNIDEDKKKLVKIKKDEREK